MSTDQIAGTFALIGQGVAAIGWLIAAIKGRRRFAVWLAVAFILLWVPVLIRMFPGEVYTLEGRRTVSASFVISRIAYVGAYFCFAASAIVALRKGKASESGG